MDLVTRPGPEAGVIARTEARKNDRDRRSDEPWNSSRRPTPSSALARAKNVDLEL